MKLAELVIEGTVTDMEERHGTGENGPWSLTNIYLVGARRAYQVLLDDELKDKAAIGDTVRMPVYVRSRNNFVEFVALEIEVLDESAAGIRGL